MQEFLFAAKVINGESVILGVVDSVNNPTLRVAPLLEGKIDFSEVDWVFDARLCKNFYVDDPTDSTLIKSWLKNEYVRYNKKGPFGDIIQVIGHEGLYLVPRIFHQAFPKPGLAADLIPFIEDSAGNVYFVGITRKNPPGVGELALIGGFLNVKGYHLSTAAEAIIGEGWEEAGLLIEPLEEYKEDFLNEPYAYLLGVRVCLGKKNPIEVNSKLIKLRTIQTSFEEEISNLGEKRVYETTGYLLRIMLKGDYSQDEIENLLEAGDDAGSLFVININEAYPNFFIGHHQKLFRLAYELRGWV